jgi:hypothetical protein
MKKATRPEEQSRPRKANPNTHTATQEQHSTAALAPLVKVA